MNLKRAGLTAMCLVFVLSVPVQAYASSVSIMVDGKTKTLAEAPGNTSGHTILSGTTIAGLLHLNRKYESGTLTLSGSNSAAVFKDGQTSFTLNGQTRFLPVSTRASGEDLMLPLRHVAEAFGARVGWDDNNKMVTITSLSGGISVLPGLTTSPPNAATISYGDALSKIIAKNNSLKTLNESMDEARVSLKDLNNSYWMVANSTVDAFGETNDTPLVMWMRQTDALTGAIVTSPLVAEITELGSEYVLRQTVSGIKSAELQLALLKETQALSQTNLNNLTLKHSMGMLSDNELEKAKLEFEKMQATSSSVEIKLKNARSALNKMIGYEADDMVIVDFKPQIKDVNVSMTSYVYGKVADDPVIKQYEEALRQAEYALTTEKRSFAATDSSLLAAENAVNKAGRTLDDQKESMENNIRDAYNTLQSMKLDRKGLELDLKNAQDAYNSALASLDAGLITQYEVDAARLGILKAEIALLEDVYAYDNAIFAFEHPSLLGGGSSGGSIGGSGQSGSGAPR